MMHAWVSTGLGALVGAAARSLLAAAAVGAGLAVLRARNVVAQKAAWVLVLAGAMLMPALASWSARMEWLPKTMKLSLPTRFVSTAATKHEQTPEPVAPAAATNDFIPTAAIEPGLRTAPPVAVPGDWSPAPTISHVWTDAPPPSLTAARMQKLRSFNAAQIVLMIYGAVCAFFLLRLLYGLAAAMRLWRNAEPVELSNDAAQLKLRSSRGLASPVTIGSGIVLPADYADWDAEKLRIVLAHEGSHVRQCDFYLQVCAGLYGAVFWFSPLGWWLKRKLSDLSETISDRAAVGQAASHASYAQVLLEFAAMPRPLPIGVAMARTGRLIPRIERLLNESSFRQAFAGGWGRIAAAVLLVPIALVAATAHVNVQAAAQEPTPPPAQAPPAAAPEAKPAPATTATPQSPAMPPSPTAPAEPDTTGATVVPDSAPQQPPAPLDIIVRPDIDLKIARDARAQVLLNMKGNLDRMRNMAWLQADQVHMNRVFGSGFHFSFGDGNAYALVTGEGDKNIISSGNWFGGSHEEIEKARKIAHGDFLWFERDGKSYVIDDPAIVADVKAMQAPIDALGKKQEELGKQQEALGKQQEDLGRQEEQASAPTPDMSKELAKLNEAISKLNAMKGGKVTQDQLAEIESRLGDLQGKIGDIEGQIGAKQGELGAKQGKLGEQQGQLGAEQGRLGAEQGRLAREMDGKILTTIDESLKNGKARPVE